MNFYDSLTDFIFVEDTPEESDIIFVPGGTYGEIAEHAAELYHQGLAPRILVSGKYSILRDGFQGADSPAAYVGKSYKTEADFLADILACNQVPAEAILKDPEATYTYENAICSRRITDKLNLDIKRAIISCHCFHARRSLLYYQLLFPDTRFYVSPVYSRGITRENWTYTPEGIDMVLGEVERCGSQFHDILKNLR